MCDLIMDITVRILCRGPLYVRDKVFANHAIYRYCISPHKTVTSLLIYIARLHYVTVIHFYKCDQYISNYNIYNITFICYELMEFILQYNS